MNNVAVGNQYIAGHGTVLETQIKNDLTGLYGHLTGVPKALLPGVGGKKILDFWWETVNTRQLFSEVYLVTNADKYKHYERWATANDFPVENVVNDGSTTLDDRLGAVADLELAIRSRQLQDDIMVIAGDMLCADQNFDIAQVIRFFRSKHDWFGGGSVMVWGGIFLEGRTDLYRLDNGTLTAIRYQDEILGPVVRPYAGAVGPGFLLVHNNAWPPVARVCRQFLENEGIDTIDWPTGSPDLNPIEHLWDNMFRSIRRHQSGELAIYYELEEGEKCCSRGIVEVCPESHRITRFLEKPQEGITASRLASVVFYCLRKETLSYLSDFLFQQPSVEDKTFGRFWEWLINEEKLPVYGMKLPTGFQLIGQVGLSDYTKWLAHYSAKQQECPAKPITCRSYARVGLMGNPSDGFNGKTIAMTVCNFWAEVTLMESQTLVLLPHPLNDPTEFGSLQDLFRISRKEGYLGGLRLLQATCKKFYQFCSKQGIALTKQNFTLKYDTNIPRQVVSLVSPLAWLAVANRKKEIQLRDAPLNAIVSATLKCLMKFYNLTEDDLPKPVRANFILNVETDELFITAGLQDRVVQVYEGLVYMDFSKQLMNERGHGEYIPLDMSGLPTFWLAYLGDPSDSGRIHSNVRQRWLNGETDVVEAMKRFAELTDQARAAIHSKDWHRLAQLMDENFELRRSVYTDDCLGPGNLKMVQLARQFGSAVKLPGSGGAVVGLCMDPDRLVEMKRAFQEAGCVFCLIVPHRPSNCGMSSK
ncbi:hypothetical protein NFI96_015674 [Prochilodus magdalenae]|nr:hypothetical protein NFI96_015674 [Prochilodus magdalenae]